MQYKRFLMLHAEIKQTDADLADPGLQRPKRSKKHSVDIPEPDNITVPSSFSSAEHDTEALMETTEGHSEAPPPQSIAEDLSCKYLLFSIYISVCLYVCLSVCLSVYLYVSMCFIILFYQWKLAWKLSETKGNMPQQGGQVFRISQHLKKLLKGL